MSGKKDILLNTALRMLEQREYSEITVLELVAESAVNRNTFYYHFKDLPSMMYELGKNGLERCFAGNKGDAIERLIALRNTVIKNKTSILHLYASAERELFDKGLDQLCEHLALKLFALCPELQLYTENEKNDWCLMVKSSCYGLFSDWLSKELDTAIGEKNCVLLIKLIKMLRE